MKQFIITATTNVVVPITFRVNARSLDDAHAMLADQDSRQYDGDQIVAELDDWDFDLDAGDIDVKHIDLDGAESREAN